MIYKKPMLIVGNGARDMNLDIQMPFLYTWGIKDKYFNHKWAKGDFGITGSPHNNKLLKEADLIIMIGTRMDTHQVPDWEKFAPQAVKFAVCIDFPHKVDKLMLEPPALIGPDWCERSPENNTDSEAYRFIDGLCELSDKDDIIIPDMGQIGCIAWQRWKIKEGQRMFNGMNHSPMGYAIPGAIGATMATGRRMIVIIGDGSLMMNLQDLQTIKDYNLPINIFVVNNGGYGMIRQTQEDWKEYLEQGVASNLEIPDIKKIADAFGIKYSSELSNTPSICEMKFNNTKISPKWKWGTEL